MASSTAGVRKRKWDQQHGGYEYDFVDTVSDKYICTICVKVLRDAHLTECCGQHFCCSCLTVWLGTHQRRNRCPHCQRENFQHMENKAIIREVKELRQLGELKSHLYSDKGCGYVRVSCINKGCREELKRKDLQTHLQEKCDYRMYECEYCGHKDTYKSITSHHHSKCPKFPLTCPNQCGATGIRRKSLPDHQRSCPLEPLNCPFKDAGCTEKIARKDMEDHMAANQQNHILQSLQSLHRSNEQIRRQLCHTNQELQDLRVFTIGLNTVGATLTLRVTNFAQLRREKKGWYSLPFSIAGKVRVCLAVYPSGIGKGQGSHISMSLKMVEVLIKEESFGLAYDLSIALMPEQTPDISSKMEICAFWNRNLFSDDDELQEYTRCSFNKRFPSHGDVLQTQEKFVKIEDITRLLIDDTLIVRLELLQHSHRERAVYRLPIMNTQFFD